MMTVLGGAPISDNDDGARDAPISDNDGAHGAHGAPISDNNDGARGAPISDSKVFARFVVRILVIFLGFSRIFQGSFLLFSNVQTRLKTANNLECQFRDDANVIKIMQVIAYIQG